ncbi:hypothetical protein FM111_02030 [Brevundimonas diminuta 3F5N]|uniref:Uncharacterized protein n=1 Tax=Brevundimonas diminuta 3F5N TaxID=1255603 RepID=A0A1R4F1M4_BREDI|nr:hypothetical protein [Brevundimonas diminuta]SJM49774.1 hypothetical protein FM111_02030 [Brevundimonas diminuta 3F5N]
MSVEREIEIESIVFEAEPPESHFRRSALVTWRISTAGTNNQFTVPIRIMVTPEYPETEVVKFARAALHVVMASLANQTTQWRIEAEKDQ